MFEPEGAGLVEGALDFWVVVMEIIGGGLNDFVTFFFRDFKRPVDGFPSCAACCQNDVAAFLARG